MCMNSFLEFAFLQKINFLLSIFQGFCLKVSEDFFLVANSKKVVHGLFKIIQNFVSNEINN